MVRFKTLILGLAVSSIVRIASATISCQPGPNGEATIAILNTFTGRLDCVTATSSNTILGTGSTTVTYSTTTGVFTINSSATGGGSALEVFSNFDGVRSSPTASIATGDALKLSVSGSTAVITVDFSSVTAQGTFYAGNGISFTGSGSSTTITATGGGGSGTVTSVGTGYGLSGGPITGSGTLQLASQATGYIWNSNALQSGATAYPSFLYVGSSATVSGTMVATTFSGSGASLTSVPASSLSAGSLGSTVIGSSLALNGVTAGTYGSATQVSSITVGGDGRITSAANVTISLTNSNLQSGTYSNITGIGSQSQALNMNSHLINNVTDPASAQDAATKNYVDTTVNGLDWKASCFFATNAPLPTNIYSNGSSGVGATLTGVSFGALTIDGYTVTVGQRVLIKNETTAANNGIYTVTTVGTGASVFVLTRAADYNQSSEIVAGDAVFVTSGTVNNDSSWVMTTNGTITVGTTPINWSQFAASYSAGGGLLLTGTQFSVDPTSGTLQGNSFNAASKLVQLNGSSQYPALDGSLILRVSSLTAVAIPGNYGSSNVAPVITINAQGQVISLSSATISSQSTQTIHIPLSGTLALESSIAPLTTISGTNVRKLVAQYDDTTVEFRNFNFVVPQNILSGSTVTFQTDLTYATSAGSKNTQIDFSYSCSTSGVSYDVTQSTSTSGTIALSGTNVNTNTFTWRASLTSLNWSPGEFCYGRLSRNVGVSNNVSGFVYLEDFDMYIPTSAQ